MRAIVSAVFGVIATCSLALGQAGTTADRVISVTATATVYAKPDVARVYYGVKASEPSADAVKDVLTKNTKAIDDAVQKLKLSNLTITSAPIGIKHSSGNNAGIGVPGGVGGPPAAPGGGGLGPFLGYTSQTATIVNSDFEKLRAEVDSFVKTVAESGANTSGGEAREQNLNIFPGQEQSDGPKVVLGQTDDSAARDQALQKAVEKALRNAKAIAKGLGGNGVKVLSVTNTEVEKRAAETPSIYGIELGSKAPSSPAGLIEVKVKVIVKCSY